MYIFKLCKKVKKKNKKVKVKKKLFDLSLEHVYKHTQ